MHLPPEQQRHYEQHAEMYERQDAVWAPEGKSPKETLTLSKAVYQGIVMVAVATAGWTRVLGVAPHECCTR